MSHARRSRVSMPPRTAWDGRREGGRIGRCCLQRTDRVAHYVRADSRDARTEEGVRVRETGAVCLWQVPVRCSAGV
eukprot:3400446-Prymnesium_polylepis.1